MPLANSGLRQGFQVGPWRVEPLRGAVIGPNGETRHVEPKVMDVLILLAGRRGEVLTREVLIERVWSRHVAADQQLTRAVSELRRIFDDDPGAPRYIETVPKRGYRLIADVSAAARDSPPSVRPIKAFVAAAVFAVVAALIVVWLQHAPPAANPADNASAGGAFDTPFNAGDPSIAVLPFDRFGAAPDNAYFSEGLADEIRNLLAGVPGLKVIGRRSSQLSAGAAGDYRSIAAQLGVTRLLEGTVQSVDGRVRIGVQLIDASDGSVVWSDTFVRTNADIFALQEDVAASVLGAMEIHVAATPQRGRPTHSGEAYGLFLKARQLLNVQDSLPAEIALREAVAIDPLFAEAWELLAFTYWVVWHPDRDTAETMRLIRNAAATALTIDAERPFARALLYESSPDDYALSDTMRACIDAARVQPNNASVLRVLSWHLLITGYFEQALEVTTRMVQIDPLSSMAHIRHAVALNSVGRADEARAALAASDHLDPRPLAWYRGELALAEGDDERAIAWFEQDLANLGVEQRDWVRGLIVAGRHTETGAANLDSRIPAVQASLRRDVLTELAPRLERWYLLLGHLDRYLEIVLQVSPGAPDWADTEMHVWYGMVYRRLGFTGHPRYVEVAGRMGFVDVWEELGPPDHCRKQADGWACF